MPDAGFGKTVQWNKRWLADKIKLVDIGADGRAGPSRCYRAEQEAVREAGAAKTTLKKFKNGETVAQMRSRVCRC